MTDHAVRQMREVGIAADGKVLVCGGEYTDASGTNTQDWDNSCEIYDPVTDSWSTVPTPKDSAGNDWTQIGDPACTLLPMHEQIFKQAEAEAAAGNSRFVYRNFAGGTPETGDDHGA